jgi:dolichyl-phosphate-mannose--protein O-mannosyl transferase
MPDRSTPRIVALPRHAWLAVLLVTLAAAVVRFPGIDYPAEEYFDEVYHAKTALEYLEGQPPTEWVHPPTAKLLIAGGVAVFGYEPWAWRLAPALAGTLLAPVFLFLAWRVLRRPRGAILATTLLLLDGVYLVQSRVAMTNIFAVLFQVLAALLVLRAADRSRLSAVRMAGVGLALGLALSTRWTSLWAWGFLGAAFLVMRGRRMLETSEVPRGTILREIALAVLGFGVLPAIVYYLSYVPWMLQNHTLASVLEPSTAAVLFLQGKGPMWDLVLLQRAIWEYHSQLSATHHYFSPWWTWPWLYRPTWYFWWSDERTIRGIVALGNPAIWWASVPAVLWATITGWRQRDPRRLFIAAGFWCLYLPWSLSPRTLNFSHYLFEALPYACLALGTILDRVWDGPFGRLGRAYLALAAVLFVLFLPLLTALPVPQDLWAFRFPWGAGLWTWFTTWI